MCILQLSNLFLFNEHLMADTFPNFKSDLYIPNFKKNFPCDEQLMIMYWSCNFQKTFLVTYTFRSLQTTFLVIDTSDNIYMPQL